jgi:predicted RNA-binding protein with PUA-like domain
MLGYVANLGRCADCNVCTGVDERGWALARPAEPDMPYWLFKEEPDHYCYADLERDGTTVWDGVSNNLARQHLRQVRRGDRILFYHTGREKAVVGEMQAVSDARPAPTGEDAKAVVVKVKAVRRLQQSVSLKAVKQDAELADWDLVRLPRLSVLPVTERQWQRIEELSRLR